MMRRLDPVSLTTRSRSATGKTYQNTSSHPANSGTFRPPEEGGWSAVVGAIVLIVNVELAGVAPGVADAGEKAQLAPAGSPVVQDSVTALLKLFFPVTIIW